MTDNPPAPEGASNRDGTNQTLGKGYQAETTLGTYDGRRAVLKSVLHPGVPLLRRLEIVLLRREARALRHLEPMEEVPSLLGYPDATTIAIEYREGRTLRERDPEALPARFYRRLEGAVQEIHRRGIVHSDLKKRENVLATPQDTPVLLDFGTHFRESSRLGPLGDFLYRQFYRMDQNAVSKLKRRFRPDLMEERDHRRLASPVLLERLDRFRRDYLGDW